MSHFTVAVISKRKEQVEELLAPYNENLRIERDIYETYDEAMGTARKLKEKYKNLNNHEFSMRYIEYLNESGVACMETALNLYDKNPSEDNNEFIKFVNIIDKSGEYYSFKQYVRETVQVKRIIAADNDDELFEAYKVYSDVDDDSVDENKNFTYMMNPNAKWDWWTIGGRWKGSIQLNEEGIKHYGVRNVDSAQIKEIDFGKKKDDYDYAMRFWQINIEGDSLREGENEEDFFCFYKPEWYKNRYHDAETYATAMSSFNTYAIVLPDGAWCGKGNMGWFGMSDDTHDEALEWELHFYDKFIKDLDPEYYISIVDCHI